MNLYHFSPDKFYVLSPRVGPNRFGGEESEAVNKPFIWLTEDANEITGGMDGKITHNYRHRVSISDNDPDLHLAASKQKLNMDTQDFFHSNPLPRWYYFGRKLLVLEVSVWDETTGHFEPRLEMIPLLFSFFIKIWRWLTSRSS